MTDSSQGDEYNYVIDATKRFGQKQPEEVGPLQNVGGGGTSDGMDPWQQAVETRLGELRTDIRDLASKADSHFLWLLGVFGAGFVILVGGMITAYLRLADAIAAIPKH